MEQLFDTLHQLDVGAALLGFHTARNVLRLHTTLPVGDFYTPDRVARLGSREISVDYLFF
jgi:hypothetical protein